MFVPPEVIEEADGAAWLLRVELLFVCCEKAKPGNSRAMPLMTAMSEVTLIRSTQKLVANDWLKVDSPFSTSRVDV